MSKKISFIDSQTAKLIDDKLMASPGFNIYQLMELAGFAVSCAVHEYLQQSSKEGSKLQPKVLILCGPGNNGGDGLVAARHLLHFGYSVEVVYPKPGKAVIFTDLVTQLKDLQITLHSNWATDNTVNFDLIVDALFGFSFQGPAKEPYLSLIHYMSSSAVPVLSVDVPSGWHVDKGDTHESGFKPEAVISLTLPKLCMHDYSGAHFVGGRYVVS